jgi:DNA-directed RNA polymerase specialized sigma24 family protein
LHRAAKPDADIASGVAARRDVVTALQSLPRREREAVALRYLLDLSERDTALALRVSVGAVKGYTSRGLARLAELLGDRDG